MSRTTEAQIAAALAVWPNDTEAHNLPMDMRRAIDAALSLPHSDGAVAEPVAEDAIYENISRAEFAGTVARYGKALTEIACLTQTEGLARAALAASPINPVPAGVGVKELEWEVIGYQGFIEGADAYYIGYQSGGRNYFVHHRVFGDLRISGRVAVHGTLSEAKAAAQADYETRIRSALILRQAPDAEQGAVYLASRYSRAAELREVRAELQAAGYKVTSRWIDGGHELTKEGSTQADEVERTRFAVEDEADCMAASIVVSFTEEPRKTTTRGGRHVEFGMARASGKRLIVIGHRENVFHCLPGVEFYPTWAEARGALIAPTQDRG